MRLSFVVGIAGRVTPGVVEFAEAVQVGDQDAKWGVVVFRLAQHRFRALVETLAAEKTGQRVGGTFRGHSFRAFSQRFHFAAGLVEMCLKRRMARL